MMMMMIKLKHIMYNNITMLCNTETWSFQVYNLNTPHKGDNIQQQIHNN
jgi:hypothetical protein